MSDRDFRRKQHVFALKWIKTTFTNFHNATENDFRYSRTTALARSSAGREVPAEEGSSHESSGKGMGGRDWRLFVYGGLASCTAEFGTFPIDTAKTRLQVQGQKIDSKHANLKYRGMIHAFLRISKEEGVRALYSGIAPAVLRQATYGTIKFGTYYKLKRMLVQRSEKEDLLVNVFCGVVAGIVSSAIANPTDVLKVRMQCHPVMSEQQGLLACFVDIYKQEGVGGLWRGVGPTAQRAAIIAGVELPVYDICKHNLMSALGDKISNHFMMRQPEAWRKLVQAYASFFDLGISVQILDSSSFVASLASAIASTPIDVIRTRLMNQRKLKTVSGSEQRIYSGSIDCFMQTVRHEGFSALYKGFIPAWVRMGPWNVIFFITYEQLKQLY